jgi:quinol monooxygenase YgiN
MKAKPGHREEVLDILLSGLRSPEGLAAAGCEMYLVSRSNSDDETIWVNEVWQSKEHHDAAVRLPETRASIERVLPVLTGEFTGQEVTVAGGLGLRPGAGGTD